MLGQAGYSQIAKTPAVSFTAVERPDKQMNNLRLYTIFNTKQSSDVEGLDDVDNLTNAALFLCSKEKDRMKLSKALDNAAITLNKVSKEPTEKHDADTRIHAITRAQELQKKRLEVLLKAKEKELSERIEKSYTLLAERCIQEARNFYNLTKGCADKASNFSINV